MDTDTNIPEEKGGNVVVSPNNSDTKEPELQTNATTTKGNFAKYHYFYVRHFSFPNSPSL